MMKGEGRKKRRQWRRWRSNKKKNGIRRVWWSWRKEEDGGKNSFFPSELSWKSCDYTNDRANTLGQRSCPVWLSTDKKKPMSTLSVYLSLLSGRLAVASQQSSTGEKRNRGDMKSKSKESRRRCDVLAYKGKTPKRGLGLFACFLASGNCDDVYLRLQSLLPSSPMLLLLLHCYWTGPMMLNRHTVRLSL